MQAQLGGFDKLVSQLSRDERKQMLERIRASAQVLEEPLSQFQDPPTVDLQAEVEKLGLLHRLLLFLRSLFAGKDRAEVIEEFLVRDLGRTIQRDAPGLIDTRTGTGKALLYQHLESLKQCAQVFHAPLSRALGTADSSFYAFLCGFEMPHLQNQLEEETNPFRLSAVDPELSEPEIRRRVFVNMEYILEGMPADGRRRMYNNAQALSSLYELSSFQFDELLRGFETTPEGETLDCPFEYIRDPLTKLAGVMVGMEGFPSARLVEALYLYLNQERFESPTSQIEQELGRQVKAASEALNGIRRFTSQVPLPQIVRFMHGSINYTPSRTSGGEEWFSRVKRFWQKRIERQYDRFLYAVKHKELQKRAGELLGEAVEPLSTYRELVEGALAIDDDDELVGRFALSLGAIEGFIAGPFKESMHAPLKQLLIDGEFYKEDNRNEYNRAFETLTSISTQIDAFRVRLSKTGDFGLDLQRITRESHSSKAYRTAVTELVKRVDTRAHEIVRDFISALDSTVEVLNGILYGEVGGKYDTIENLGQIGGRSHKRLMAQLDQTLNRAREVGELMREIVQLEETASAPEVLLGVDPDHHTLGE